MAETVSDTPGTEAAARRFRPSIPPAMRYAGFRVYWTANLASVGGFQMFRFTQLWIIHDLNGSPLYLGYLGLAQAAPTILLMVAGGIIADCVGWPHCTRIYATWGLLREKRRFRWARHLPSRRPLPVGERPD